MSTTIDVSFVRTKRGKAKAFITEAPKATTPARPSRVARMLALAHTMRGIVDRREVISFGDLAVIAGVTRPRVSQLLDLTLLAPDIQEELLFAETAHGPERVTERALRAIVRSASWTEQRRHWRFIRPDALGPANCAAFDVVLADHLSSNSVNTSY